MTPEDAIGELLAGNQRYVEGLVDAYNPPEARADLAMGQAPFAAILRCADSRVAPEIVFDQPLGNLFVCGVSGNIPTTEIIASLEFGVSVLGCLVIVVMGHTSCLTVTEAVQQQHSTNSSHGSLSVIIDQIALPNVDDIKQTESETLNNAIAFNALYGVERLMNESELIASVVNAGDLRLFGGVLDIGSGQFILLG